MRFAFTDEQEQLRLAVRRFLGDQSPTTEVRRLMATDTGYDPLVWQRLCSDLALAGVHIPQNYGGQGFTAGELAIVVEEMGRALLCAPYFSSTVLSATAILYAGTEADKAELLPTIAAGESAWLRWRSPNQQAIGIHPGSRRPCIVAGCRARRASSWMATSPRS